MLPLIALVLALAGGASASPASTRSVNTGFPYGGQKIRGVNLGGVSERPHRADPN